ncbi:beta-lactamase family protein [Mycobacterium kansasii]|uniref:Beta-lactamase family protein n=1 Tax=Mycobacterium kansasii TaxID=1768 RepID=A0A1V3XEQ7_MYCKA|nr:beta-lactamase family protein [Mycobacterium kansasii]
MTAMTKGMWRQWSGLTNAPAEMSLSPSQPAIPVEPAHKRPGRAGKRHRWGPLLAVALLLGGCAGQHTAVSSSTTTTTTATSAANSSAKVRSQAVLDGAVNAEEPGCSAAVGVEGKVVWTGVRGIADLATGTKITADTVFDIGSVAKQFTATAILLLVDAGRLALSDPLAQYVPDLPDWAATVTVAELMHQTSGIPDYIGLLEEQGYQSTDRTTQAQALQALAAAPELGFRPGAHFEYSNSNYLLLGEIVRRVSGHPLPEFLSTEVFQPLGLAMAVDPVGKIPDKAVSYDKGDTGSQFRVLDSPWEQIGDGPSRPRPANSCDGRTTTEPARWVAPSCSRSSWPGRWKPSPAAATATAQASSRAPTARSNTAAAGRGSSPSFASAVTGGPRWPSAATPKSRTRNDGRRTGTSLDVASGRSLLQPDASFPCAALAVGIIIQLWRNRPS